MNRENNFLSVSESVSDNFVFPLSLCSRDTRRKGRTVRKRAQRGDKRHTYIFRTTHNRAIFSFFEFSEMNRFTYPAVDLESLCLLGGCLGGEGTGNGNRGLFHSKDVGNPEIVNRKPEINVISYTCLLRLFICSGSGV